MLESVGTFAGWKNESYIHASRNQKPSSVTCCLLKQTQSVHQNVSELDQEIPQTHNADKPTAL